ncbi:MAG: leucine-rich repeat protein [Clostridia bacterium]|nr:leucine-rich repeat protein [Clostridia bacterium]
MKQFHQTCALLLALLCLIASLSGCTKVEEDETVYYTITFDSKGGTPIEELRVAEGQSIPRGNDPTREGWLFEGWKTENGAFWNFESDVAFADITLVAAWIPATDVFDHEPTGDGTTTITRLLKIRSTLPIPTILDGLTVTAIGEGVFAELSKEQVTSISLPETVTSVGEEAFYECRGIELTVDPRAILTEVGAGAFYGCDGLRSVTLGEGMTSIAPDAFFGCRGLKEIRIPKSVTVLEDNAFADCTALVTVMLYSDVTEVCDSAFKDCDALRTIYFYGNEAEITTLRESGTAKQNDAFLRATVYFYSATKPESGGNYWYLTENDRPKLW